MNITEITKKYFLDLNPRGAYEALLTACCNGSLESVKFLLTNENVEKIDVNEEESFDDYTALQYACSHEHLNIVKFLLTLPTISESSIIKSTFIACRQDNKEILKELLNTHHFINKSETHKQLIVFSKDLEMNNIIDYLIFEYKMPYTREIKAAIVKDPELINIFEKRELYYKCQKDLSKTKLVKVKVKL